MKRIIDVDTGDVAAGGSDVLLRSSAIGSCVALVLFDPAHHTGGLAHIMLPGRQRMGSSGKNTRYSENAIEKLRFLMKLQPEDHSRISSFIIGGADVLKRSDSVGKDNVASIERILKGMSIKIQKRAIGGYLRRTVLFDVGNATLHYTEGDSSNILLWQFLT